MNNGVALPPNTSQDIHIYSTMTLTWIQPLSLQNFIQQNRKEWLNLISIFTKWDGKKQLIKQLTYSQTKWVNVMLTNVIYYNLKL